MWALVSHLGYFNWCLLKPWTYQWLAFPTALWINVIRDHPVVFTEEFSKYRFLALKSACRYSCCILQRQIHSKNQMRFGERFTPVKAIPVFPLPVLQKQMKGHNCCTKRVATKRRVHSNWRWSLQDVLWFIFLVPNLWMGMFMINKWQRFAPAHAGPSSDHLLRNWQFIHPRPALIGNTFFLKAELHLHAYASYFLMLCICISNTLKGVKHQIRALSPSRIKYGLKLAEAKRDVFSKNDVIW